MEVAISVGAVTVRVEGLDLDKHDIVKLLRVAARASPRPSQRRSPSPSAPCWASLRTSSAPTRTRSRTCPGTSRTSPTVHTAFPGAVVGHKAPPPFVGGGALLCQTPSCFFVGALPLTKQPKFCLSGSPPKISPRTTRTLPVRESALSQNFQSSGSAKVPT